MGTPLEKLAQGNRRELYMPSPDLLQPGQGVITLINDALRRSNLETVAQPLQSAHFLTKSEDNPLTDSIDITDKQIQAIMYIAPGHTVIQIGRLNRPISVQDMSGNNVQVQTLVVAERPVQAYRLDYNPDDQYASYVHQDIMVSIGNIYAVSENGEVTMIGHAL